MTNTTDKSKNHHFVPQRFLKAWTYDENNKYVYCYDQKTKNQFQPSISGINSKTHLHTIFGNHEGVPGFNLHFEQRITRQEEKDMGYIDNIRTADKNKRTYILNNPEFVENILLAIVHMKIRNPIMLEEMANQVVLDSRWEESRERLESISTNKEDAPFDLARITLLSFISSGIPPFMKCSYNSYKINIRTSSKDIFLCGTSPAQDIDLNNLNSNSPGVLPISPKRAIVYCRNQYNLDMMMDLSDEKISQFSNKRVAMNGRFIISNQKNFLGYDLEELIRPT